MEMLASQHNTIKPVELLVKASRP